MKLCTFSPLPSGSPRPGLVLDGKRVVDIPAALGASDETSTMLGIIRAGKPMLDRLRTLESKPGKGERSPYGSVKSWIDPRRLVPLRVEKYSGSGKLVRRIDTTRVVMDAGHAIPANLAVQGPRAGSITQLDGSKINHDVSYTDKDFAAESVKELTGTARE